MNVNDLSRMRTRLLAAIALQALLLCSMSAVKAFTLATGTPVTLRSRPVDPWDMFRGDYVRLGYDISTPPVFQSYKNGQEVFVLLERGEPYWHAVSVSTAKPVAVANQVVLKGNMDCGAWFGAGNNVHYGIEQYYVPEGTGMALEKAKNLRVDVVVDCFGNAAIRRVSLAER